MAKSQCHLFGAAGGALANRCAGLQYFETLELACASKHAGIVAQALDCTQKLIA